MRRSAFVRIVFACAVAFGISVFGNSPHSALEAAAQKSGSIGPSSGAVTWSGFLAPAAAAADESTCAEGLTCDTFLLNVEGTAADWAGKTIPVAIRWTLPTSDFDLYIHKESNSTPVVTYSAGPPPSTSESTAIDPSSSGTGLYSIHVVYFAVAGDQYQGTASVSSAPTSREASYVKGGITFSPNVAVKAPAARADGEPSNRTDKFGNHYVAGIRGVPAGTDLWYFNLQPGSAGYDPYMRKPIYRGQPDGFVLDGDNAASVGADGGGDIDLAVGFGPANPPPLAGVSLVAANISAMRSTDAGDRFTLNPVGSTVPVDDRQWIEAYRDGDIDAVYLYYRTISVPVNHFMQRSNDGGLTFGPPVFVGLDGQTGYVDIDQRDGTVYASRQGGSKVTVAVGVPPGPGLEPLTYTDHVAVNDASGVANIFAPVKVADDGTVYVSYSNGRSIFLVHSSDKGRTWSPPVRVSDGPETRTSLFPWIETGSQPGSIAVVWYGTSAAANADDADWHVFFAQSLDANTDAPTFRQVIASDHVIHGSNISTGGLLGAANRNLLDYFQVSIDPVGAAVIGYTNDHNDFSGHTFVTRQISGPGLHGGAVPSPGPAPAPTPPAADGSQVVDFKQDQITGLLMVAPVSHPLDITSIRYSCEDTAAGRLLVARMKVSYMPAVTPTGNWRMNFAANAPFSTMSPTGEYSFGLSDRGDQFFLRASTDTSATGSFTFGTAVRNSDGSLTYTTQGAADAGAFDALDQSVTVKVLVSRLNSFVSKGPAIGAGSVLAGLRGQTFTTGANAVTDIARGGTQYELPASCAGANPPPPPPPPPPAGRPFRANGAGGIDGGVSFNFNADNSPTGHLNYRDDVEGIHLVSTKIATFLQTGTNEVTFNGTGMIGDVAVTFEVTVVDNGEPGKNDVFRIEISGGRTSSRSGALTRGNIQVHK